MRIRTLFTIAIVGFLFHSFLFNLNSAILAKGCHVNCDSTTECDSPLVCGYNAAWGHKKCHNQSCPLCDCVTCGNCPTPKPRPTGFTCPWCPPFTITYRLKNAEERTFEAILNWGACGTVEGYDIYRSIDNGPFNKAGYASRTSRTWTGLTKEGLKMGYKVIPLPPSGCPALRCDPTYKVVPPINGDSPPDDDDEILPPPPGSYPSSVELDLANDPYVLFFDMLEVDNLTNVEKVLNQPQKIYRTNDGSLGGTGAYFRHPCRFDSGYGFSHPFKRSDCPCQNAPACNACTDPNFCQDKLCDMEEFITWEEGANKCCNWDWNPRGWGISGQVIKIGNKWLMYTPIRGLYESSDGLNWSLPNPLVNNYPIMLQGNDPNKNFGIPFEVRPTGGASVYGGCFYRNHYSSRKNRVWIKEQYWHDMFNPNSRESFTIKWSMGNVIEDPNETDSTKRFKMLVETTPDDSANRDSHPEFVGGLRLAYSPDGINWREARKADGSYYSCDGCAPGVLLKPNTEGADCYYDPSANAPDIDNDGQKDRWKCYGQCHFQDMGNRERAICMIFAPKAEGPWKKAGRVFAIKSSDSYDNHQQTHGGRVFYYQGYHLLFHGFLNSDWSGSSIIGATGNQRVLDIRLGVSRDGVNFKRVSNSSFLPNTPKPTNCNWRTCPHDAGNIWSVNPAVIGGEMYFYYRSSPCLYFDCSCLGCTSVLAGDSNWLFYGGLAKMRLDGLTDVQLKPNQSSGTLLTKAFKTTNKSSLLFLNSKIEEGGELKMELLDANNNPLDGFRKEDFTPITGDNLKFKASWQGKEDLKILKDRGIGEFKIKFYLAGDPHKVKLYSFHFVSAESGNCPGSHLGNLDCDSQGLINEIDLTILLQKWSPQGPAPTPNPNHGTADLDNNGKVDEIDLTLLLSNWRS